MKIRNVALDILMRIEKEGSFSHLLISDTIRKVQISQADEKLLTEIVYGTMERKLTLDYYIQPFIRSKKKVADWVFMLLRLSVFQMVYLDKVPEYAIINEAVEIAKKRGHKGIASFVNGVLRNIVRQGPGPSDVNKIEDRIKRLSIETSHPEWLVNRWIEQYGYSVTENMCRSNLEKKPIAIRVNQMRATNEEILELIHEAGIEASLSPFIKDGILIDKGNILKTGLLEKGLITIQDQSSMLAALSLQVEADMKVLDTCSAPGGKATYIGELMKNRGVVIAYDLHQNKTRLIRKNAERLGLTNIKVGQNDARKLQTVHEETSFDRILIDAPCSGLGVIRTKPDIKYNKQLTDIHKLHEVQFAIIDHVAPLLKVGGKLVYSTCTVDKLENEEVVKKFLRNHENFEIDESFFQEMEIITNNPEIDVKVSKYGIQLFPQTIQSDGFFISRLERKR